MISDWYFKAPIYIECYINLIVLLTYYIDNEWSIARTSCYVKSKQSVQTLWPDIVNIVKVQHYYIWLHFAILVIPLKQNDRLTFL